MYYGLHSCTEEDVFKRDIELRIVTTISQENQV